MACGCQKRKNVQSPPGAAKAAAPVAARSSKKPVVMNDVFGPDGALVASFSNLVTARAEARRVGGNVVPRTEPAT